MEDLLYTAPLSEYEEEVLLPIMVECLKNKKGIENAVCNSFMCGRLKSRGYDANSARIRKIINRIRTGHHIECLVASSKGYYITDNVYEMSSYIESLKGREDAIRYVREAMEEQLDRLKKNIQIPQNQAKVNVKSEEVEEQ